MHNPKSFFCASSLDLYLNKRAAHLLNRLPGEVTGPVQGRAVKPKNGRWTSTAHRQPCEEHDAVLANWTNETTLAEWGNRVETSARRDPKWNNKEMAKVHKGLTRAQSSLLIQARTGHIGLWDYLATRNVVDSPCCDCEMSDESFAHLVTSCPLVDALKPEGFPTTPEGVKKALERPKTSRPILRWVIRTGCIPMYNLANQLETELEELTNGGGRRGGDVGSGARRARDYSHCLTLVVARRQRRHVFLTLYV